MKNKNFLLGSVLFVLAVTAAALFITKKNKLADDADLAKIENLIRPHSYIKGPANAKVTLVEFLDPECEACRAMYPVVQQLYKEYEGQLRIVYRYTPFHPNSIYAASVLEEARAHGKFEEALDLLFSRQPEWGGHHAPRPEMIPEILSTLGFAPELFNRELVISKYQDKISIDQQDGQILLVTQTPTFFVNQKKLYNIGYDFLKMAIDEALKK